MDNNKALDYFKDWSNYLLVTTVAAIGWVGRANIMWCSPWPRLLCVSSLTLSVWFGIFTLALVPLVAEQRTPSQSIYHVEAEFNLLGTRRRKLKSVCFWQHVLFLFGVLMYAAGTGWRS
jgi:hypothetical protein